MPDGSILRKPDHYGNYETLRVNRESDLIQMRKYRALADMPDLGNRERLKQWADIHQRSADEYTTLLNERGFA